MELRQLGYFVAVADTGSFKAAAKRCYISQSAISQQVKNLEEELDTLLLIRNGRDIELTESGAELLSRAKKIIKQANDAKENILSMNHELCGELHIGIGSFIEPYIRTAAVKMMELHPKVQINVIFNKACYLNRLLCKHELDMAFTANTALSTENIISNPCIPLHLMAIMGKTHPLTQKDIIEIDDLYKYNIILPDAGERVFNTIKEYVDIDFDRMKIRAVVNSPGAMLNVLDDTKMITFLPGLYSTYYPELTCRPIRGLENPIVSNVHFLKDVCIKKSAQEFLKILKEYSLPYHRMATDDR